MKAIGNQLKLTRVYDAPVRVVWDAWTDTEQVAKWWGPRGFTITTHSKDLRPGGHWAYTMHGPDGTDYENKTIYHEVEECAKLVYDHGGNDDRPPLFRVDVRFRETAGKTTMDMTMTLASEEAARESAKFIKQVGGNSTWDRLGEYLEKNSSGVEKFIINRVFEAPRDVVFAMWTDPKHFVKWLPPKGFTMEFLNADIRPGGRTFYKMTNGEINMYGKAEYLENHPTRAPRLHPAIQRRTRRHLPPPHDARLAGDDADHGRLRPRISRIDPRHNHLGAIRYDDQRGGRCLRSKCAAA